MIAVRPICYSLVLILGALIAAGCDDSTSSNTGTADNAANIIYISNDSTESYVIGTKDLKFTSIVSPYAGNWVAVDGDIFNSTDGGDHWAEQAKGYWYDEIHALANNPQGVTIGVGDAGRIEYSTNSGFTWDTAFVNGRENSQLVAVNIFPSNLAIAVGDMMYKSDNGGVSWDTVQVRPNRSSRLYGVCIVDPSTAVAVGQGGTIIRSRDGGETWTQITVPGVTNTYEFHGITSIGTSKMMIAGNRSTYYSGGPGSKDGVVLLSTDGGKTWSDPSPSAFTDTHLTSVSHGYSSWWVAGSELGAAAIWKSTDDGATWQHIKVQPGLSELRAIKMLDDVQGFAVGEPGVN